MESKVLIDDLFLPAIFGIFVSSLSTVFYVNYYLKPFKATKKRNIITTCLYIMSVVSFILPLQTSWIVDFLHQMDLISEPVLWQRLLGDFILAHKLTLDTTENYWITSQMLLYTLSFVVLLNMYSQEMKLRFHHIVGYLALGLTGSNGGVLALFLVHFYYVNSLYPVVAKINSGQFCAQVISTIFGCAVVLYLYDASVSQIRAILLPFLVTAYLLPFALFPFQEATPSNTCNTKTSFSYFLISLGGFITLHHLYMTYKVAHEWMSFRTMLLVAFGHPYQRAIVTDLICCTVISFVFVILGLHSLDKVEFEVSYSCLKGLAWFLGILVVTLVISPGAVLLFFLAYRERLLSSDSLIHY